MSRQAAHGRAVPLDPLAFALRGSRLIEASAGTGKTFTIALLYVRLVLGHGGDGVEGVDGAGFGRPLVPPEILVVTFTEAATQELRERIRARLVEASACFSAPGRQQEQGGRADALHDPVLLALRADYPPGQWAACARRLRLAAEWMDEAAVSTIHGWCWRMLREHAFDSGNLFQQDLLTDESELLTQVVRDYWRRSYYPLPARAVAELLPSFAGPDALAAALRPLLARPDARITWDGEPVDGSMPPAALLETARQWRRQRDALDEAARRAWREDGPALADLLRGLRAQLNGTSFPEKKDDARFEAWLAGLQAWSRQEQGHGDGPQEADAAELKLARLAQGRIRLTGKNVAPAHAAFAAIEALVRHEAQRPVFKPQLLLHALHAVRDGLAREKQRRAELSFDDLLARLDLALAGAQGSDLARRIRAQFPVALIDEFQDTDPLQYRIFQRIYHAGAGAEAGQDAGAEQAASSGQAQACAYGLFMIGDPKQAIYAFRGADIHTYLQARRATEGRHYTLTTNFRSTQGVVNAVNHVFGHAEAAFERGAFRFATDAGNPVPFLAVQARGRAEQLRLAGAGVAALNVWTLDAGGDVVGATGYREQMAERSASAIVGWLAEARRGQAGFADAQGGWRALRPADIAILVRGKAEAEAVRRALARRQVASVYLSDRDSVFASAQAQDVLLWLQACADPGDDGRLRAALASASMARAWAELDRLNEDELHWEETVMRFHGYKRIWQQQGVLPMLRRWLADFEVPARLLGQPDGERGLTNLLHLAEWLQRQAVELDGEQALIRALAEQVARPTQEEILRLESDADLIKVVTIHKSKGLEYPLVLLPFACAWKEVDGRSPAIAFHRQDPGGGAGYTVELSRDKGRVEAAYAQANDERLSEDMRLLYVALTRARHAIWLGVAPLAAGSAKSCELHKGAIGYLLGGGQPIAAPQLAGLLGQWRDGCADIAVASAPEPSDEPLPPQAGAGLGMAREPVRRAREAWWIASYSALRTADEAAVPEAADSPPAPEPASAQEAALREAEVAPDPAVGWAAPASPEPAPAPAPGSPHAFPKGPGPGSFLHGLLELAAAQGFASAVADPARLRDALARRCATRGWEHWIEPLGQWLLQILQAPLALPAAGEAGLDEGLAPQQSLHRLASHQSEMEFWFAAQRVDTLALDALVTRATLRGQPRPRLLADQLNGMLKGYVDLVFEHQGRYYVADYKSNWLGPDDGAYTRPAMAQAMLAHRYDLQAALYLLALHRLLRARLPDYDYERHVGGALYLFLRGVGAPGHGAFALRPPLDLIEALDALFAADAEPREPMP